LLELLAARVIAGEEHTWVYAYVAQHTLAKMVSDEVHAFVANNFLAAWSSERQVQPHFIKQR
jgi:hypothetical protein